MHFFNNRLNISGTGWFSLPRPAVSPPFPGLRVSVLTQAFVDEGEDLFAPGAFLRRGDEHRRQLLPLFGERRAEALHALLLLGLRELVGLGEDDGERDAVLAQHLDEAQVDLLGFEPDVRQHEQEVHLLALENVVGDEFRELSALRLRRAGVAVAGQIDEIPGVVDAEMVHQTGFAGRSRHLGQPSAGGEHVDERRLADVAAPDEGDVFQAVFRDLRYALRRAFEFGFGDLHRSAVFRKDSCASREQRRIHATVPGRRLSERWFILRKDSAIPPPNQIYPGHCFRPRSLRRMAAAFALFLQRNGRTKNT